MVTFTNGELFLPKFQISQKLNFCVKLQFFTVSFCYELVNVPCDSGLFIRFKTEELTGKLLFYPTVTYS